jgi:hypothetical protein
VDSSPCIKAVGTEGARRATGVPTATPYTSDGEGAVAQCLVQSLVIVKLKIPDNAIRCLSNGLDEMHLEAAAKLSDNLLTSDLKLTFFSRF